jgi:hypothetical protein
MLHTVTQIHPYITAPAGMQSLIRRRPPTIIQHAMQSTGAAASAAQASPPPTARGARAGAGATASVSSAPRRIRSPNFFVGFRITNSAIIANVTQLQHRIATQFPDVARCIIDARTLHVTLCTLHLANEQGIVTQHRPSLLHLLVGDTDGADGARRHPGRRSHI